MSSSTRPQWALEELGIPFQKQKLNLADGDQKKPEYLKLNPNGKVPLLVIDGMPIFESLAILIYLGETYGVDKGLFPAPGLSRAEALKWMVWSSVTVGDAVSRVIRNTSDRFPAELRNEKVAEAAKKEIGGELFGILDNALEGKEYLVDGKFTFADLANAGYLPLASRFGIDTGQHKNISAWMGRCIGRPALARAMAG
jgi:glutathione S-transferase